MQLRISPVALGVQVILVSLTILQRETQHNTVDNSEPFQNVYDYIIVGAGSAGCVVARRLSDDKHVSVLLLEAGGPQSIVTDLPGMERTVLASREFNWNYPTVPQRTLAQGHLRRGVINENKGFVFGGTAVINRMVYLRPNPKDFEMWVHKYGAKDWSFRDVLPFFVMSENNTDYQIVADNPGYHGTDGLWGVSSDPNKNILLREVQSNYNVFGIPTTDLNGPQQSGSGMVQLNIKDGFRSTTANAYLEPNPNPNNLFISLNSLVTRLIIGQDNNGKLVAMGVEFLKDKQRIQVRARREVIVSGGTYESAKLLMLSGIGPSDHLRQLGIPVLVDLSVGNNLMEHPAVQFEALIRNNATERYIAPIEAFPSLDLGQINQLITEREGPLATSSGLYTYYSTRNNRDKSWPNIVLTNRISRFSTNITDLIDGYSAKNAQEWIEYFTPLLGRPYLVLDVFLRKLSSKGTVRLASADPLEQPLIDPNFLANEWEVEDIVEAIKFELFFAQNSGISNHVDLIPRSIPGCTLCTDRPIYECDEYIRCYIRELGSKEHHCCGTCRMGDPRRSDTVVDTRLRVKHVENLRVCDASVMPHIPNSNTHAATVMIGERCAHFIRNGE